MTSNTAKVFELMNNFKLHMFLIPNQIHSNKILTMDSFGPEDVSKYFQHRKYNPKLFKTLQHGNERQSSTAPCISIHTPQTQIYHVSEESGTNEIKTMYT